MRLSKQEKIAVAVFILLGCLIVAGTAVAIISLNQAQVAVEQPIGTSTPIASITPSNTRTPTSTATRWPTWTPTSISSPTTSRKPRLSSDSADGYTWRAASTAEKVEYCKWISANEKSALGKTRGWDDYYSGLEEFYNTTNATVLTQKISETAALLGVLSDIQ